MKKLFTIGFVLGLLYLSTMLRAGQVVLFNNTDRAVEFSFKFFHQKAKQEMVISGFQLKPREKTRFPQPKDLNLANPLKLKVRWVGDTGSAVSKTFAKNDATVHDLHLINRAGRLVFSSPQFTTSN